MTVAVISVFLALMALAAAFAAWPILRWKAQPVQGSLAVAAATFLIFGIGGGVYYMTGAPYLAARSFSEPSSTDLRGLIAALAERVRARPDDAVGWTLLGRGYLTLNDPADAAAAFRRALAVAKPEERSTL